MGCRATPSARRPERADAADIERDVGEPVRARGRRDGLNRPQRGTRSSGKFTTTNRSAQGWAASAPSMPLRKLDLASYGQVGLAGAIASKCFHSSEAGIAAHHPVVGIGGLLKGQRLDHRAARPKAR